MATLHLMVGLPCSGKTTLAKQLEQQYSALRLTPDEWHTALFGYDVEEESHDTRHSLIEARLWEIAGRALALDVNVILDFGFWAKVEREDYRARAKQLGAGSEIHFLDVPEAELFERLAIRHTRLKEVSLSPRRSSKRICLFSSRRVRTNWRAGSSSRQGEVILALWYFLTMPIL
jgi:predicted kinase